MSENIYGYIRVSSKDQNAARQCVAMQEFGVPEGHVFIDKRSGKAFERPPDFIDVCEEWRIGRLSAGGAARKLGITHRRFIKWTSESIKS